MLRCNSPRFRGEVRGRWKWACGARAAHDDMMKMNMRSVALWGIYINMYKNVIRIYPIERSDVMFIVIPLFLDYSTTYS